MRKLFTALYGLCFTVLAFLVLISPGIKGSFAYGLQKQSQQAEYGVDRIDAKQSEDIARTTQRVDDIDKRISAIESQKEDSRITRLEAVSESNHQLLIGISLSIAALILEAMVRLFGISRRTKQGP